MSKDPKNPNESDNGEQKYPRLVSDGLEVDPNEPDRYTYTPQEKPIKNRFNLIDHETLLKNAKSINWLVEKYLEQDCTALLFGASQSYKSFITIDLGLCIATGIPWHGHAVKQGPVVYVCGEGHHGIARRVFAWHEQKKIPTQPPAPFFISERSAQLTDIKYVMEMCETIEKKLDTYPVFIVIDTLARNFGPGNENATQDMGAFVDNIDVLLRNKYSATVMIVHHIGHSETQRARGAYALHAATDMEFITERINDSVLFHNTKVKDGPYAEDLFFDAVENDTPLVDDDGIPMTSLALALNAQGPPIETTTVVRGLGKMQKKALRILTRIFETTERNMKERGEEPPLYADFKHWRNECKLTRFQFRDAKDGLLRRGIIEIRQGTDVYKGINWFELEE